jgi:ABC-type multidrug transport system fused ATPase/permease subunit
VFRFFAKHPIFLLLYRGWQYADRFRPLMVLYLIFFVVAQVVALAEPYVIGRILNSVQAVASKTGNTDKLWSEVSLNLWLFFWIQFVFWLFHGPGRVIERYVAYHIKTNYKQHLFNVVTALPLQWHRQHHSGESIDKINRATNSLATYFDCSFEVSYMIMRLVGSLIALFWFMPYSGAVAIATTVVCFANVYLWDKYLEGQYGELNSFENKVASAVHDYVSNIGSVITLRLEERVSAEVLRRMLAPLGLFKKNAVANEIKWCIVTMLIAAMTVIVLFQYAHGELAAGHAILAGTFFTLFEYLRRVGDSFYQFAGLCGQVVKQAADVRSAETIFEAYATVGEAHVARLPGGWKQVEVTDLRFKYEDEKHREHHLANIEIDLAPGKTIALVGESGCGKSTLLSLLRGLVHADNVVVRCDGTVMEHGLRHLAEVTTLIPQDPEIFSDTIGFNITFGMEATPEEVLRAVRLARFDQVLARLPNGLETNIAEKGVNLSGGEKQRLALARGIFFAKDSDILLMDEPTSSVDPLNERIIYANVMETCANKCVISSIHKLHLLEMFDEVYVFENGQLVERGSFAELLTRDGKFARLWRNYQAEASATAVVEAPSTVPVVAAG